MNLKQFHVFFIVVSVLCTLGFAAWIFFVAEMMGFWGKAAGVFSALLGVTLIVYGGWFLRKAKHIIT